MKFSRRIFGLTALAALGAASAPAAAQPPYVYTVAGEAADDARAAARLEVRNQEMTPVTVYAWNGARRVRLGSVPALSTGSLTLPTHLVFGAGSLQFELDPLGSRGHAVTDGVMVGETDRVVLTIPPRSL